MKAWSIFIFLVVAGVYPAMAVMPPAHYARAVENSTIKAVARIIRVETLSVTPEYSSKEVSFSLVQAFEPLVPDKFTGQCRSVDVAGQDPGVGGEVYFYPQEGSLVLVTVSQDKGRITSLTPMDRTLTRLVNLAGLSQIRFVMGKAVSEEENAWGWYLFEVGGQPYGYLALREELSDPVEGTRRFRQDFMVREPGEKARLFQIRVQARTDGELSLERLSIAQMTLTDRQALFGPTMEVGFKHGPAKVAQGLLLKKGEPASDLELPSGTTSDFLLFSLVQGLNPAPGASWPLNVVETLELHLKVGLRLDYKGKDPSFNGFHRFALEPGPVAQYWLDGTGHLVKGVWDGDKRFTRMGRDAILEILIP